MTYTQTLVRKAASMARRSGWWVIVSDAETTESSYLYLGSPSPKGGFTTHASLRVSYHRKPGWLRGGWIMRAYYDLRPRSRRHDMERIVRFLALAEQYRDTSKEQLCQSAK